MLSDTQISRLLDVANAACHGGNVVDARLRHQRFVHIGEAGLVLQEAQIDIRDRTVTVLGL